MSNRPRDKKSKTPTTAVALHYDGSNAPKVTAKGSGDIAEQIIAQAKEHGIPLQENKPLVELLSQLDLGDEIPEALYLAVAEIIAFAYMLNGKVPEGFEGEGKSS
jgi:flagellar biosynthesis protein